MIIFSVPTKRDEIKIFGKRNGTRGINTDVSQKSEPKFLKGVVGTMENTLVSNQRIHLPTHTLRV